MAWKGYKKPLEVQDLWELNPEDKSRAVVPIFDKHWSAKLKRNMEGERKTTIGILPVLIQAFGAAFFMGALLKFIPDLLAFASPQILE